MSIKLELSFKDFDELQKFLDYREQRLKDQHPPLGNKKLTDIVEAMPVAETVAPSVEGAPDFTAVKNAVLKYAETHKREEALAVLAKFNDKNGAPCTKVTAVLEKDYAALLEAVKS